ncbi:MAG: hypothetical protein HQL58_11395 [Magnetococcales bacterium]|nr:hypothetical protein [Magnetococcales bacterium]
MTVGTPSSMTCSPDSEIDKIESAALQWLGHSVRYVAAGGGGNNRLYRLTDGSHDYALKYYLPIDEDGRDRLMTECNAIAFLQKYGVQNIPLLINQDRQRRCALFHWVHGTTIASVDMDIAQQMVSFLGQLRSLEAVPEAAHLGMGSDACLAPVATQQQFNRRWQRFEQQATDRALWMFLQDELWPTAQRLFDQAADQLGEQWHQPLLAHWAMLSPSDFGIHNALRCADGQITFLDFEFFGWDDPVKLTSDILWHPAMPLSCDSRDFLQQGIRSLCYNRGDHSFDMRLTALLPIFGVLWCLILLNPFLPSWWQRSGVQQDRTFVLNERLMKARQYLARILENDG